MASSSSSYVPANCCNLNGQSEFQCLINAQRFSYSLQADNEDWVFQVTTNKRSNYRRQRKGRHLFLAIHRSHCCGNRSPRDLHTCSHLRSRKNHHLRGKIVLSGRRLLQQNCNMYCTTTYRKAVVLLGYSICRPLGTGETPCGLVIPLDPVS